MLDPTSHSNVVDDLSYQDYIALLSWFDFLGAFKQVRKIDKKLFTHVKTRDSNDGSCETLVEIWNQFELFRYRKMTKKIIDRVTGCLQGGLFNSALIG